MKCLLVTFSLVILTVSLAQAGPPTSTPPVNGSCGNHATYFDCGASCDTSCATLNEKCTIVFIRCPDGCYCDKGYARDDNNKCIPIAKCNKRPKRQKCVSVKTA